MEGVVVRRRDGKEGFRVRAENGVVEIAGNANSDGIEFRTKFEILKLE
jgi:hypothetical protein